MIFDSYSPAVGLLAAAKALLAVTRVEAVSTAQLEAVAALQGAVDTAEATLSLDVNDASFVSAAMDKWGDGDCEIDGDVSRDDEGAFVAAWVYVYNSQAGIADEETD